MKDYYDPDEVDSLFNVCSELSQTKIITTKTLIYSAKISQIYIQTMEGNNPTEKKEDSTEKQSTDSTQEESKEEAQSSMFSGEVPVLFSTDNGKNEFYPTMYGMLLFPNLGIRQIFLKQTVEHFIIKGADLMWPGVYRVNERDLQKEKSDAQLVADPQFSA